WHPRLCERGRALGGARVAGRRAGPGAVALGAGGGAVGGADPLGLAFGEAAGAARRGAGRGRPSPVLGLLHVGPGDGPAVRLVGHGLLGPGSLDPVDRARRAAGPGPAVA